MAANFSSREYFNWGFHDGAADVAHKRANKWATTSHFNQAYKAGYLAGFSEAQAGRDTSDSQAAWDWATFWGDI
jgi:hypothetical protein